MVGLLIYNVIAGLYQSDWALSPDAGLSAGAGEVHACDFPVPPSWP